MEKSAMLSSPSEYREVSDISYQLVSDNLVEVDVEEEQQLSAPAIDGRPSGNAAVDLLDRNQRS